jgi:NAD(P)-dependent dehydrogenase (short-subunit alcohol dehydrogenase family)
MEFAGKVVLVTSATSGIGQAIAMAFAAEGALVLGGGRSAAGAAETERLIAGRGGTFRFVATDISAENEAERAVQTALDQWGRLDCAVNNAAIGINAGLLDYTVEDCDRILATNVRGLFLCLRAEIRAMHQAGSGAIVTIGSAAGHRPYPGNSLYNASKSAASMLTRSAALEFAPHGIRINEVAPGPVRTPMLEGFSARLAIGPGQMCRPPRRWASACRPISPMRCCSCARPGRHISPAPYCRWTAGSASGELG